MRKSAAVIAPAYPELDEFTKSAILLSNIELYGSWRGIRQTGSEFVSPWVNIFSAIESESVNMADISAPTALRAAPVSVAKSIIRSGSLSLANARASHSSSLPSASVLSISTVNPFRVESTSPGRKAFPEIEVLTHDEFG